ncbi:MAG TPA: histidine kinase dimerization/phosphoacceptor domain -containing protein [Anaerolineaceae bacterium]|nr:PAS domain-containing protein [Longilinea sp.]HNS63335.1 histidine kinase dimerization/phosphoacceptor domain -containing protein [Anaerolineaceae bacterium]HNZ00084.1 histidine kinase dimerization/phosphoacceptor domain -containing protein [Anaerolineaceae bacterium]HOH19166.1 histidine kinase dimerization/phosphoacceptor domain -containing protein [Anaerolineaceae bacterium]HOU43057.1 histidine kinase dimerization/phosphoacceptor domain -containing protein [Anaerolineaceae bacterium]
MKSIPRWFEIQTLPSQESIRREVLVSLLGATVIGTFYLIIKDVIRFLGEGDLNLSHLVGYIICLWILVICLHYIKWGWLGWVGTAYFLLVIIGIPLYYPVERMSEIIPIFIVPPIAASFLVSPISAVYFSLISLLVYSLWFWFGVGVLSQYNFIFVITLLVVANFSWLLSTWFLRLINERESSERKYLTLVEQSPVVIYQVEGNRSKKWTYISPQIENWLGFTQTEWLETPGLWARQIHPEDRDQVLRADRGEGDGSNNYSQEYRIFTQDGRVVWVQDTALPIMDAINPSTQQGTLQDITDRKRVEQVQKAIYRIAEAAFSAYNLPDLYRLIHHVLSDLMPAENFFIALYHPDDEVLTFDYFVDTYDTQPTARKIGKSLTDLVLRTGEPRFVSPEDFRELERQGVVESIGTPSLDWLGVPLKVRQRTIGVMVVQSYQEGIRFKDEHLDMMIFVSNQVAMAIERRRGEESIKGALQEKEVLLREIHHRVKNNLQVISSLLSLQADHVEDPQIVAAFRETQARVRSMSLIHEELYQASNLARVNFSDYLRRLTGYLANAYGVGGRVRIHMDVRDVLLGVDTAIPLGLIVNELVSNALKHAFPDGRHGEIALWLTRIEDEADQHWYELVVQDNGKGFPDNVDYRNTDSLGLQLVQVLSRQLRGHVELSVNGGTRFSLHFPEPHHISSRS